MVFAVRMTSGPAVSRKLSTALGLTVVCQVAIGFTQYFLGVPTGLVAIHVAGATLLWILALYLRLSLTGRVPVSRAQTSWSMAMARKSSVRYVIERWKSRIGRGSRPAAARASSACASTTNQPPVTAAETR